VLVSLGELGGLAELVGLGERFGAVALGVGGGVGELVWPGELVRRGEGAGLGERGEGSGLGKLGVAGEDPCPLGDGRAGDALG
jgi:hypothetical protein